MGRCPCEAETETQGRIKISGSDRRGTRGSTSSEDCANWICSTRSGTFKTSGQEVTESPALSGGIGANVAEKEVRLKLMFVTDADDALVIMLDWGRGTGLERGWWRNTPIVRERSFDIGNDALTWSQRQVEGQLKGIPGLTVPRRGRQSTWRRDKCLSGKRIVGRATIG